MAAITQQSSLKDMDVSLLNKRGYDAEIYMEMLLTDPLLAINTLADGYVNEAGYGGPVNIASKGKAVIKVNASKDSEQVILKKMLALQDDFTLGASADQTGQEEEIRMRTAVIRANEYFKSVPVTDWGKYKTEAEWTGLFNKVKPLLGQAAGEYEGLCMREAIVTGISSNLNEAPYSGVYTYQLNRNVYVPGVGWVDNEAAFADYADNIATAMTGGSATNISMNDLLAIPNAMPAREIAPLRVDGGKKYLLFVHPDEFTNITSTNTGTYGALVTGGAVSWQGSEIQKIFPSFEVMPTDQIIVFKDERCPVITVDEVANTATPAYKKLGKTDDRDTTAAKTYYCNYLIGEEALAVHEQEVGQYRYDDEAYKKFKGVAWAGVKSYQSIIWEYDGATEVQKQQGGSALILTPIIS